MNLLSSLILICLAPSLLFSMGSSQEPIYCKLADQMRAKSAKKIEQKYEMKMCGIKDGMMKNINLLGFSFEILRPLTKNEARALVVSCAQEFLKDINKDKKIRPYLNSYPFNIKDIQVSIYIYVEGEGAYHPHLGVVSVFDGKVAYSTDNPKEPFKYAVREIETFEDAVKILNGEMPAPESQIK